MVTHCIIMSSSYSEGTRIAIDYCAKEADWQIAFVKRIAKIIKECGTDVSISTHYIQTESEDWKSVCKKDAFFKDVRKIDSLEEFIELIKKDRELNGTDIAKYILSKIKCTHLKLQKLVYLCYAEYLCETGNKLFEDTIYAFKLGPVVDSVYQKYKGYDCLLSEKQEDVEINSKGILEMPSKSRLLFAKNGVEKTAIIDRIIKKYGDMSASGLVQITHQDNTPWSKIYDGTAYEKISDASILKYHKYEV